MKTALQIAKNETPKDRKAKEQPRAENAQRIQGGLQTTQLCTIFIWGASLTHRVLALFVSVEFLLHIPCWLQFYLWSFSYTSHAGFIFLWAVSLTHPLLASLLNLGSFSDTSRSGLPFHVGRFSYTSLAGFIFIWGVSLTHPVLALFASGEFLLHIPCWLHFYLGSFSYTSHAGFIFIWGVSLTHPMRVSFLSGEFLLHIS